MSEDEDKWGTIVGFDLTVPHAEEIRDFYSKVVGWTAQGLDMGDHEDFLMCTPEDGVPRAGVCHARGENADLPAQWLTYILVEDLDTSVQTALSLGGTVVAGPKGEKGSDRYVVVRDPAGAVIALREER